MVIRPLSERLILTELRIQSASMADSPVPDRMLAVDCADCCGGVITPFPRIGQSISGEGAAGGQVPIHRDALWLWVIS